MTSRRDPIAHLEGRLARGHDVTLVLGAGVSLTRGVPSWVTLARTVAESVGLALPRGFETSHPMALPIAFELAEARARRTRRSFDEVIRRGLYAKLEPVRDDDTLGLVAALVRREQKRDRRVLRRVITFNADDLLEIAANGRHDALRTPVVWPIARESYRPRKSSGAGGRAPIPVYHLHGFLPQHGSTLDRRRGPLVFTDASYWASFAEPTSFPNRVMANALHDSVCVFVGLSMTDLNLARWLGIRAHAIDVDHGGRAPPDALAHHFWIRKRPVRGSSDELVGQIVRKRGVHVLDIDDWPALAGVLERISRRSAR